MSGHLMVMAGPEAGAVDGLVVARLETLARESSMSVKTLRRHIATAERGGWLKVVRFHGDCYGFIPTIPEGHQA